MRPCSAVLAKGAHCHHCGTGNFAIHQHPRFLPIGCHSEPSRVPGDGAWVICRCCRVAECGIRTEGHCSQGSAEDGDRPAGSRTHASEAWSPCLCTTGKAGVSTGELPLKFDARARRCNIAACTGGCAVSVSPQGALLYIIESTSAGLP